MDIDPDVSRWILEFILRKPLDDKTFEALIRVLPPPNDNPGLMKTILLRDIESEASNGCVSETMVGLLEKFEELDFREGIEASQTLRAAYCAVAVDCTVRCLKNGGDESGKIDYFSAVKRIWRKRICRMKKEDKVGLVSEDLWNWRDKIEEAVWDDTCCDNVIRRSERVDAVEAVKVFVKETREKMGPSFLEYMSQTLRRDDHIRELLLLENKQDQTQIAGKKVPALQSAGQASTHNNIDTELQKGKSATKHKHVACKRASATKARISRGAKIADTDDLRVEASNKQYNLPDTPEVNKAQKALETSSRDLQAVVKDPLPDALLVAATIMRDMAKEYVCNQPIQENPDQTTCPVGGSTGDIRANGGNLSNQCDTHQANPSKRSLMERRSTAHVLEWDDSIDGSSEGSPSRGRRIQLPSPKRRNASPLKEYEIKKLAKRRKSKKWSLLEEDTLRTGVQKFGKGNWKLILHAYRDIFEDRTEVDLKDKWRNMTRY